MNDIFNNFLDMCASSGVRVHYGHAPESMMYATRAEKCAAGFHAHHVDPVAKLLATECTFCEKRA